MSAIRLLLVEDNPADAEAILEILAGEDSTVEIELARDGQQALDFLRQGGRGELRTKSNLVILDLNLPKLSGRDVLAEIRADDRLRQIPVIVLTSSGNESEIAQLYAAGANCYLVKPLDHSKFIAIVRAIAQFWFLVAELPH